MVNLVPRKFDIRRSQELGRSVLNSCQVLTTLFLCLCDMGLLVTGVVERSSPHIAERDWHVPDP